MSNARARRAARPPIRWRRCPYRGLSLLLLSDSDKVQCELGNDNVTENCEQHLSDKVRVKLLKMSDPSTPTAPSMSMTMVDDIVELASNAVELDIKRSRGAALSIGRRSSNRSVAFVCKHDRCFPGQVGP